MQEDIENKTLSLMINTGKLTERTLATAVTIYLPLDLWQPAIGMGHLVA